MSWACAISAQSYALELSHDTIYLNESVTITYTLENLEGTFEASTFAGWSILGPSTSISNSWINGVSSSKKVYRFQLFPESSGVVAIEEATILVEDDTITFGEKSVYVHPTNGVSTSRTSVSDKYILDPKQPIADSLTLKLRKLKTKKI